MISGTAKNRVRRMLAAMLLAAVLGSAAAPALAADETIAVEDDAAQAAEADTAADNGETAGGADSAAAQEEAAETDSAVNTGSEDTGDTADAEDPEEYVPVQKEIKNGSYQIVSASNGTVLSTTGRGARSGAAIACRTDRSLTLQTYSLKQDSAGTVVIGSRTAEGKVLRSASSGLELRKQKGNSGEQFVIMDEGDGTVSFRLKSDTAAALTNQNGYAVMTAYTGAANQKWTLRRDKQLHEKTLETGVYTIDNTGTGDSMAAESNARGTAVSMMEKTISGEQKFKVIYCGDGKYKIRALAGDGKRVSVSAKNGSVLQLGGTAKYYIDQKWDGSYAILRAGNSYTALKGNAENVTTGSYTGTAAETWTFDSHVTNSASKASAKLQKVMLRYPSGTYLGSSYCYNSGYQCMGFGREVFSRTFGRRTAWIYDGTAKTSADKKNFTKTAETKSYSGSSLKKTISKAKPGDVLQMDAPKIHTMIFVSSDSTGFTVYDANWVGYNTVSIRHVNWSDWSSRNSRKLSVLHSTYYPAE